MEKKPVKAESKGKKLFWQLHHWVGLYTGILIGILSITGALAVFIPEIDGLIQRYRYNAASSPSADGIPRFGNAVDSLLKTYPEYRSISIALPDRPGEVANVNLVYKPKGGKSQRYEFFVDTGKDRVAGQRAWQSSLSNYLRQMHVRLYEGNWGRQLVGIGGIALTIVTITGLVIYGNFMKNQLWGIFRKSSNMRIIMADWHKILGIGALAFNLVIALTGAWLGLQPWLMKKFKFSSPRKYKTEKIMKPKEDRALPVDWDMVLQAAKKEFPDFRPRSLTPSMNGAGTITLHGDIPGLIYERNINMLVLSKKDLTSLFKYDIRRQAAGHKFYYIQEALHFGDYGGLLLKALYALLGLTSAFLSISGFAIFLFRGKKKTQPQGYPWKVVAVYSMLSILFLVVIAFISLFVGYNPASKVATYVINGTLLGVCANLLIRYLIRQFGRRRYLNKLRDEQNG